jgi:hypothetical protein
MPTPLATAPRIRCYPLPIVVSSGCHALVFCVTFVCKHATDLGSLMFPISWTCCYDPCHDKDLGLVRVLFRMTCHRLGP